VGADGPTHHGLYDMAFLRCMPNLIIMAPKDENELRQMLQTALYCNRPAALRYPRGAGTGAPLIDPVVALPIGKGELLREGEDLLLVAIGTLVAPAAALAARLAAEGLSCAVINARFVKPIDRDLILHWAQRTRKVVALEEGCAPGGFTGAVAELLADEHCLRPLLRCAVPDHLVNHGDQARLMDEEGLSPEALYRRVLAFAQAAP
jgi:1-deoxy-D-xylulose-5-phosphate synthase